MLNVSGSELYTLQMIAGPCRLTLELVSEEVGSAQLSSLYPFNALRNHALLLVKTEVRLGKPLALLAHGLLSPAQATTHLTKH